MADPRTMLPPPDLVGAYLAGIQAREAGQRRKMNDARLSQVYAEQQREAQERAALAKYNDGGDLSELNKASPELALKMGEMRAKKTEEWQQRAVRAIEANPQSAALVHKAIRAKVDAGEIDNFELPGQHLLQPGQVGPQVLPSDEEIASAGALAGIETGQQQRSVVTGEMANFERAQKDPGFAAYLNQRLPQGARERQAPTAAKIKGGGKAQGGARAPDNKISDQLRREFQGLPVAKDTAALATAYEKIANSGATGAGDMGLVFGYMKLLDPNSTVREGEFDKAMKVGGLGNSVISSLKQLKDGQMLTDEQRAWFKNEAASVFQSQLSRYRQAAEQYKDLARRRGADPRDVVLDLDYPDKPQRHQRRGSEVGQAQPGPLDAPPVPQGRVRIILPDGRRATLPQEQVEAFIAQNPGAKAAP